MIITSKLVKLARENLADRVARNLEAWRDTGREWAFANTGIVPHPTEEPGVEGYPNLYCWRPARGPAYRSDGAAVFLRRARFRRRRRAYRLGVVWISERTSDSSSSVIHWTASRYALYSVPPLRGSRRTRVYYTPRLDYEREWTVETSDRLD